MKNSNIKNKIKIGGELSNEIIDTQNKENKISNKKVT